MTKIKKTLVSIGIAASLAVVVPVINQPAKTLDPNVYIALTQIYDQEIQESGPLKNINKNTIRILNNRIYNKGLADNIVEVGGQNRTIGELIQKVEESQPKKINLINKLIFHAIQQ